MVESDPSRKGREADGLEIAELEFAGVAGLPCN